MLVHQPDYNSQDAPRGARYRPWGRPGRCAPRAGYSCPFPGPFSEPPGEGCEGQGRDCCEVQPPAGLVQLAFSPIETRLASSPPPNSFSHPCACGFFRASCGVYAQITTYFSKLLMETGLISEKLSTLPARCPMCTQDTECYFASFGEKFAVVALLRAQPRVLRGC